MNFDNSKITLEVHCPVVTKRVTLRFIRFIRGEKPWMVDRNCSQLHNCLELHGGLDKIPDCLLHKDW